MTEYKTTQESILAAASKCSTAKDVLQTMFPDAFEEEDRLAIKKDVDETKFDDISNKLCNTLGLEKSTIQLLFGMSDKHPLGDKVRKRGFYLKNNYRWEAIATSNGGMILMPHKK